MASISGPFELAPTGSTGNNSHTGVALNPDTEKIAVVFIVEAVGATPTVTFEPQGSLDGTNWFSIASVSATDDTVGTTSAATSVGRTVRFIWHRDARFVGYIRLVTTANTNVTYSARAFTLDSE